MNMRAFIPDDVSERIFAAIAAGASMRKAVEDAGVCWESYVLARARNPALHAAHMRARQLRTHDMADEVLEVIRNEPDVARARVLADNMWRYVEKVNPKEYGPKLDVTIEERPSIRAALEAAARRASLTTHEPARDDDAQPVDAEWRAVPASTDKQSADDAELAFLMGEAPP